MVIFTLHFEHNIYTTAVHIYTHIHTHVLQQYIVGPYWKQCTCMQTSWAKHITVHMYTKHTLCWVAMSTMALRTQTTTCWGLCIHYTHTALPAIYTSYHHQYVLWTHWLHLAILPITSKYTISFLWSPTHSYNYHQHRTGRAKNNNTPTLHHKL